MPTPTLYPWDRRWLPISTSANLFEPPYQLDGTGYVSLQRWVFGGEPEKFGFSLNELTEQNRCVVLLGEPGIGKSQEWQAQESRLQESQCHVFLDLGTIDSEEVLRREVYEDSRVIAWRENAASYLTIWLDSLDEGLLHIATLRNALVRTLRTLPLDRLCLRVMCRSAVWPVAFSEELTKLLRLPTSADESGLLTLLLSPLSQNQVAQAAELESFAAEQFLEAVAVADAQPLAARPVTLSLLFRLYRKYQNSFGAAETANRTGIYELGCLELCERPDRFRPDAHRPDSRGRLVLAGYVAMLTVLTNRRLIFAEPASDVLTPTELDFYSLGNGTAATWNGTQIEVTAPALRDLFKNTGLFTDLGAGRLVWAHQSYAEFLAAWYLNLTGLPVAALRTLFRSESDPTGGIVPALRESAGWLADLQPAFWLELLALDPVALIQSDLRRLGPNQRERLVGRLVEWFAGLANVPYQSTGFMQYLRHPELAHQLTPLLTEPSTTDTVLRFVTELACQAEVVGLQPVLVRQAADNDEPFATRLRALRILHDIADYEARETLRPLRLTIPAEDSSDEFRGYLLRLLWPSHLTVDEVFPLLTRRRDRQLYGMYSGFLDQIKQQQLSLSPEVVLAGLRWLNKNTDTPDDGEELWHYLTLVLQKRAWELADDPRIMAALADAFVSSAQHTTPFLAEGSATHRLSLFTQLLHRSDRPEPVYTIYDIVSSSQQKPLMGLDDWDAIMALVFLPLSRPARVWVAHVLRMLLRDTREGKAHLHYNSRFEQLYRAASRYPSVRGVLGEWCAPSDLRSDINQRNRKYYFKAQARKHKEIWAKKARRLLTLHKLWKRRRSIGKLLQRGNDIDFHQWAVLLSLITREKIKNGYSESYNIAQAKRWGKLHAQQQIIVVDMACAIISRYPSPPDQWYWLGNSYNGYAGYLYRTLVLCYRQRPTFINNLPFEFWGNWAAFILHICSLADENKDFELLNLVASNAPMAVDEAVERHAQAYHDRGDSSSYYPFAALYQALPETAFAAQLLAHIEASHWRDDYSATVLVDMLKVGYAPAQEYARTLLTDANEADSTTCSRPELAAAVYGYWLFDRTHAQSDGWEHWVRLSTQPAIAATVVRQVSRITGSPAQHLVAFDEVQLEALILWLTYAYDLLPEDVDDWKEVRFNGPLAAVRTAAAAELASRGTTTALELLRRLTQQLGNPYWLAIRLDQVRENLRRNAWKPILPDALAELSRNANRRWVSSATDLQDVLLESLDRFQMDLQGEPTTAEMVWIPVKDPTHKSRITGYEVHSENYLSNMLRHHFHQDLQRANILIKREVEIRPSLGAGTGQRTDIFVEAFVRDASGGKQAVATVVVEVKLSRNDEVETALNEQLVGYLADQQYKHGIFLVGWHYGQYDPKPPRKKDLSTLNLLLNKQAEAASIGVYSIKSRIIDIRLPADTARE